MTCINPISEITVFRNESKHTEFFILPFSHPEVQRNITYSLKKRSTGIYTYDMAQHRDVWLTLPYVTKHKTTWNGLSQQKSIPKQIIGAEEGGCSTLTIASELAEKNLSCFNQYVALEINYLAAGNSVNNFIICSIPS